MYVAGGFFSILATYLLIRLATERDAGRGVAVAYVATLFAGVGTVELFWPLIGMHVLWAVILLPRDPAPPHAGLFAVSHRIIGLQVLAIILSAPELLHGVYRARRGAVEPVSIDWMREYLSFGFLFRSTDGIAGPLRIGTLPGLLLFGLTVILHRRLDAWVLPSLLGRTLAVAAFAGTVAWMLQQWWDPSGRLGSLLALAVLVPLAGGIYLGGVQLLGVSVTKRLPNASTPGTAP